MEKKNAPVSSRRWLQLKPTTTLTHQWLLQPLESGMTKYFISNNSIDTATHLQTIPSQLYTMNITPHKILPGCSCKNAFSGTFLMQCTNEVLYLPTQPNPRCPDLGMKVLTEKPNWSFLIKFGLFVKCLGWVWFWNYENSVWLCFFSNTNEVTDISFGLDPSRPSIWFKH